MKTSVIAIIFIVVVFIALPIAILAPYFFPNTSDFFITTSVEESVDYDINLK